MASWLQAGKTAQLPGVLGGREVFLVDEYRPGIWQVRIGDVEFLISAHMLLKP